MTHLSGAAFAMTKVTMGADDVGDDTRGVVDVVLGDVALAGDVGEINILAFVGMRDKDVLFAANAATYDTAKFLQFVRLIVATANDTIVSANNVQVLRINSKGL